MAAATADTWADGAWVPERGTGRVLGVIGGCGGAGASVLAVCLALAAAARGPALLVDLDPLGGGVDLLLGAEDQPGLRWGDLGALRGRVPPGLLREGLPVAGALAFLTWARGDPVPPPVPAVAAVLSGAREEPRTVVVDLPRAVPAEHLGLVDEVFVVVPGGLRAVAAARTLVARMTGPEAPPARVVVRGRASGLPPSAVADVLGLPLAASLRPEPGLVAALEAGRIPTGPRSAVAAVCRTLLAGQGG